MKRKALGAAAALLLVGAAAARADDASSSKYAAAYLLQPTSARALGMGNAYVGLANDTQAIYYNPAGLAFLRYSGLGSMYSPQSFDQTLWSLEYVQSTQRAGGFGAAVIMNQIGSIEGRADEFAPPTNITSREGAFLLSYGYAPAPNWSVGVTGKYLFQRFTNLSDTGSGRAFDLGAKWAPRRDFPLTLGLAFQNVAGKFRWSTGHDDPVLFLAKLGAAYRLGPSITAVLDTDFRGDRQVRFHAGSEIGYSIMVFRLGADHDHPTFGFGVNGPNMAVHFRVDYAFELDPKGLEDVHRLGLSMRF